MKTALVPSGFADFSTSLCLIAAEQFVCAGRITGCNCDEPPVALVSSSAPAGEIPPCGDLIRLFDWVIFFLQHLKEVGPVLLGRCL